MSLRVKIVLAILVSAALTIVVVTVPTLLGTQRLIDRGAAQELRYFRQRIHTSLDSQVAQAGAMAALIAAMPSVQRAVAAGDRAALDATFVPGFEALKTDHRVGQFQFHSPDAHSLLRVHKPAKFGDDLSGFRKTVVEANDRQTLIAGLERGRAGLGVRGVAPISDGGQHVGTVDFGLALDEGFFLDFTGYSGALIEMYTLPDSAIAGFSAADAQVARTAANTGDTPLLEVDAVLAVPASGADLGHRDVAGMSYAAAAFPLTDFSGQTAAVLHVMVPTDAYLAIARDMQRTALLAGLAALLGGALFAWLFGGRVAAALMVLIDKFTALAGGDTSVDADLRKCGSRELRRMAEGIVVFRKKLLAGKALERETAESHARQAQVVALLGDRLQRLATGDLSARIEGDLGEGYRQIGEDFNAAMTSLSGLVGSITEAAQSIDGNVQGLNVSAQQLSRRTETTAATLEQTAAALQELTHSVDATAEGVQAADGLGREAIARARDGEDIVKRTFTAMGEIEGSAAEIARITDVIEDIAFQTNLLALNAGVEAARAGAAGSGFAAAAPAVDRAA